MKRLLPLIALLLGFASAALGAGANTTVKLLLSHREAKPGETITAALQLVSKPGWHTYWKNGGDAGLPPSIEWQLPNGISAGSLEFPVPEKLQVAQLYAYVYEGEILLLLPLKIPANAKPGPVNLNGTVSWLECDDKNCYPQDAKVSASFTIGAQSELSSDAPSIEKARERLPISPAPFPVSATWEAPTSTNSRPLVIEWQPNGEVENPDFFPEPAETFSVTGPTEVLEASSNRVRLRKTVELIEGSWPGVLQGLVLNKTGKGHPLGYAVKFRPTGNSGEAAGTTTPAAAIQLGGDPQKRSLAAILALAFLGGLILNIMPCVLPVIALKILGFVNQSREAPGRVRQLGIIYMLGVLASFLVLAGVLLAVKKATGAAGWGFQMQNPYFVIVMTVVVTLIALNLFGVFEITLGSGALGGASELASREGRAGAFYNGVLATLLSTPCSAPALGAAIGAVITQPAQIIVITFLTIGLGLAFPYVVLCWNPRWLKLLPKPGTWMEKFKISMGFPMLATALWLLSIASAHYGRSAALWIGLFLVALSLAAWVWGDFVQRGSRNRGLAMAIALLIAAGGYGYALEKQLNWREPPVSKAGDSEIENQPGGIQWQKWSSEAVARGRAEGRPVLVDFTAVWCLTCQLNKTSLEADSVVQKAKEMNVLPLIADYTKRDPVILQEIIRLGRGAVPVVVIFPADPNAPPILLPEIFSPGTVLEALALANSQSKKITGNTPR